MRFQAKSSYPLLYGVLIAGAGCTTYAIGVLARFVCIILDPQNVLLDLWHQLVWYSGTLLILGGMLIAIDLFLLLPGKRARREVMWDPPNNTNLTVVLTAYNDESSIGPAVRDFAGRPEVIRVIVIDNNSRDRTSDVAREAGAHVVVETKQGYGHCVWRALKEASRYQDTDLTVLCEGDMTFRAYDVAKLLAYAPHADIVNGTRIVEQLRERDTQLTTFMYFGNFFAGKLLEAKHIGRGTFTDLGTTYKLCRNSALEHLLPLLDPSINLEFNAYFLDMALTNGYSIVECPVTFHSRVGTSKGGNVSNIRALRVGLRMIWGIAVGWSSLRARQ
jgi:glycosyltransferase involved in cell wall biosynthesis